MECSEKNIKLVQTYQTREIRMEKNNVRIVKIDIMNVWRCRRDLKIEEKREPGD